MKNFTILILSFTAMVLFTQCSSPAPEKICDNTASRGRIISELMNNDTYMSEVMDSMKTKHQGAMMTTVFDNAKGDNQMQSEMMNKMMEMCKMDSSMCKMMMDKTMEMCESDSTKCNMMMNSMKSHPKVKMSMEGMNDMKGMK